MKLIRYPNFFMFVALLNCAFISSAHATSISCGDKYRTASLSAADTCYSQTIGSTAKASDINTLTGSSWSMVSALNGSGKDGWFNVSSNGWGGASASGTWSINELFWDNFTSALISVHVGGGQKNAVDNFEWLITSQTLSGTFDYLKISGKGGGLSNIKLWGMGTVLKPDPTPVAPPVIEPQPTPSTTPNNPPRSIKVLEPASAILFALGLLGLTMIRRKHR